MPADACREDGLWREDLSHLPHYLRSRELGVVIGVGRDALHLLSNLRDSREPGIRVAPPGDAPGERLVELRQNLVRVSPDVKVDLLVLVELGGVGVDVDYLRLLAELGEGARRPVGKSNPDRHQEVALGDQLVGLRPSVHPYGHQTEGVTLREGILSLTCGD